MQQNPTSSILPRDILGLPAAIRVRTIPDENGKGSISFQDEDFVLLLMLEGTVSAEISGQHLELSDGDAIMINSGRSCSLASDRPCRFYSILVNPALLQNSISLPNYIMHLTDPSSPAFFLLQSGSDGACHITEILHRLSEMDNLHLVPYRLAVIGCLHLIVAQFMDGLYLDSSFAPEEILPESRNLDRMLSFIHRNFQSRIQLDDIADAGNVSRSRCSPIFRKYLHVTPIEYVNNYRLEVSRGYLLDRSVSIASVAGACGFSGQSYYTKLFVRKYGYTPTQYRSRVTS